MPISDKFLKEGLAKIKDEKTEAYVFYNENNEKLSFCPPLIDATDFFHGYSRGITKHGENHILLSHMRGLEGNKEVIDSIENLANAIYQNPLDLLSVQQTITLMDSNVFNFLLDIVRYRFLEQIKSKVENKQQKETSEFSVMDNKGWARKITISDFSNAVKANFKEMENNQMLDYNGLMHYSVPATNLKFKDFNLPTAIDFALGKYYIDIFEYQTMTDIAENYNGFYYDVKNNNINDHLYVSGEINKKGLYQIKKFSKLISQTSEDINNYISTISDIRDQVVTIHNNTIHNKTVFSNTKNFENPNIDEPLNQFFIAKFNELFTRTNSIINKNPKNSMTLSKYISSLKGLLNENKEKEATLSNVIDAFIDLDEPTSGEGYNPKQF